MVTRDGGMALVQDEWSRVQGFQRVRSTVAIRQLR
jgi:hypothetical protein